MECNDPNNEQLSFQVLVLALWKQLAKTQMLFMLSIFCPSKWSVRQNHFSFIRKGVVIKEEKRKNTGALHAVHIFAHQNGQSRRITFFLLKRGGNQGRKQKEKLSLSLSKVSNQVEGANKKDSASRKEQQKTLSINEEVLVSKRC